MPLRVDVVTGETVVHEVDLRLPGYLPLTLARTYRSGRGAKGAFGKGWKMSLRETLTLNVEAWIYESATRRVRFEPVEEGVRATHASGLVLEHHPDAYLVYASPRFKRVFPKAKAQRGAIAVGHIEDPSGNEIKFFYDGDRLAGVVDTLGRRVLFDYRGPTVSAVRVGGPGGGAGNPAVRRKFRYDGRGRLTRATDAAGRSTNYVYSSRFLVRRTGPSGAACCAQYDADGRCHTRWREDGSGAYRFFYDHPRQTTRVVSRDGRQTLYRYVVGAGVLEQVDPKGAPQNYYYDEQQRLIGFSDELETVVTFQQLDPDEQTLTLMDGEERMAFLDVNEERLAEAVSDPFDHQWRLTYDEAHHPVRLTTPDGETWTFERGRRGDLTEIISPEGRRVYLQRGEDGRALTVRDERGVIVTERYDDDGRLVEREDAGGCTQRRSYDAEGRLTGVTVGSAYSMQFRYDAAGRLTRVTDPSRGRFTLERDAFGRLRTYTGADRTKFQFQYDDDGRLADATDAQQRTAHFAYDGYGRLTEAAWPGGRTTHYQYGEEGMEARTHTPEGEALRTYNAPGDLTREVLPDGTDHTFEYGPSGELLSMEEEGKDPVYFDYHPDGPLAEVMGAETTLSFSYDRDGNLTNVEDDSGRTLTLARDDRGRVKAVRAPSIAAVYRLTYDAGGRMKTLRAPAEAEHTFRFDALGRLRERTTTGPNGQREKQTFPPGGRREPQIDSCPWPHAPTDGPRTNGTAATNDAAKDPVETTEDGAAPTAAPVDGAPKEAAGENGQETQPVVLELFQSRSAVALLASWGTLRIPLWVQHDALHRHALTPQIVTMLVRGPEAALSRVRTLTGPELLRRWTEEAAHQRLRRDYTALPLPHEVGRGWRTLRHFFLAPAVYDYHYQQSRPGDVPDQHVRPARTPHPALTGSHVQQRLKPPAWEECAVTPYLNRGRFVPRPGGLRPEDVMQVWEALPTPSDVPLKESA